MAFVRVGEAEVEYDQRGDGANLLLIHSLLTELTVFDSVLPELAQARRVTAASATRPITSPASWIL
jgi:hypothetical protein